MPSREVGAIKELERLIDLELSLALGRLLAGEIGDRDEVLGVDGDTASIRLSLVQSFIDTLVIVTEKTAVLHKLDCAFLDNATTLRVLVHDGHLDVLRSIAHCDG